jgi:hypothetical protein
MIEQQFEIKKNNGYRSKHWRIEPASDCDAGPRDWPVQGIEKNRMHFYDLRDLYLERPIALRPHADESLEEVFSALASQWKKETWFLSSPRRRISHPAYLKVIGLGAPAIPLLIRELRDNPDQWVYALEAITREDPAPNAQSLAESRAAWLAWANQHGY